MAEGAYVVAGSLSTENLAGIDRVTPVAVDLMPPDGPAFLVQATEIFGDWKEPKPYIRIVPQPNGSR